MIQFTMIKYYCLLSLPELNVIYLSFHFSHYSFKIRDRYFTIKLTFILHVPGKPQWANIK